MNTAGAVVLAIVLLLLAAAVGWIIFTRVRASRLGLPPPPLKSYIPFLKSSSPSGSYNAPSPAPGGLVGWFNDRIRLFRYRNTRTAAGAYEGSSSSAYNAGYASTGPERGRFAPLDDDAWDARVGGHNPYEEERELGLVPPGQQGHGHGYGHGHVPDGEGYQMNLAVAPGESGAAAAATPAAGGGGAPPEEEERRGRTRSRSPGLVASTTTGSIKADPFGDDAEPSNISLRGVSPRPMDTSFAARKAAKGDEDRKSVFREDV